MKKVCIGVDLGTSVVKATALDTETGDHHQISDAYASRLEQASPPGWSAVLGRILRRLLAELGTEIEVEGLAITAMVPNVALLSQSGQPIGSLLFCDNDAYALEIELDALLKSPKWANEVISKILYLSNRAEAAEFSWYTTHNWLVHELTGEYVIDSVTAGECGTLLTQDGTWDSGILTRFSSAKTTLPAIVPPATIVGKVRADYPITSLQNVPVACGTSDTIATALGAGWGDSPDSLLVYYGTFNCAARIRLSRREVLESAVALNPFDWILSVPQAGRQLAHMASLLTDHTTPSDRLAAFDDLASKSPRGANGLVYLHAEDLRSTTVSSSPKAALRNLQPHHTRSDIARSVLEGFAYYLRWALEEGALSPTSFPHVLAAGGGAKSALWRQIVSDVCALPQRYRPAADRGLGSALLAMSALAPIRQ